MHPQQIGVASENQLCSAIQRYFQKLVVPRIAAFPDKLNDGNEFGGAAESTQEKHAILRAYIMIKFWAGENLGQFIEGGLGKQQDAVVQSFVNSSTWIAEGHQDCA